MPNYKSNRLAEDIKRELSVIMRELKDPRIAPMLSIVKIDLSNDLSHCKVYISSMDGMDAAKESVKGLQSASGFIKHEIFKRLPIRKSPEFKFIADDSIEYGSHINQVIRSLDDIGNNKNNSDNNDN